MSVAENLLIRLTGGTYIAGCRISTCLRGTGGTRGGGAHGVNDWAMRLPQRHKMRILARRRPSACLLLGFLLLGGNVGCERAPEDAAGKKPDETPGSSGIVRLTPEAAAGIEMVPVVRSAFRLHRDFPATVQPNENELAEVTTLIRGRVAEVYVDFGQDVHKGTPLALLHSTELGLAEAAHLKSGARLHEAVLVYERARDLLQHKAISQAEFQRREAEMKTARPVCRPGHHAQPHEGRGGRDQPEAVHRRRPFRSVGGGERSREGRAFHPQGSIRGGARAGLSP